MARSFFTRNDDELFTGSENFASRISASYSALGLTQSQSDQYALLNSMWRSAYLAIRDPATRTAGKLQAKKDARAAVCAMAADLAKIIIGQAGVSNEEKLNLGLNVRAAGTPMPPPGRPERFRVSLLAGGELELRWKCKHARRAAGAIYHVWRRNWPSGEFVFLGQTGKRRFTDKTLPAGSAGVIYKVQAIRSTSEGEAAEHIVNFGVTPAATQAASAESQAPKLAA